MTNADYSSTFDYNETTKDPYYGEGYGSDHGGGDYGSEYYGHTSGSYYKAKEPLDYSVASVGVMTLGLILCVEVCRHQLDNYVKHGHPFFKSVLEMVYSELATLGLVELFVFLLLKYYDDVDKDRKAVFADVHFALFYTAIFNAFQSILVAFVTSRASKRKWVRTEHLELDHYVEIREAFDRVDAKLKNQETKQPFLSKNMRSCIHPRLKGRYMELLVQVRFHELRLHFLERNRLPLCFKVSDYLKRSEQGVLISLVHISELAWLLLTGGLTVVYFVEGIVANHTHDTTLVGHNLTVLFFSLMIVFIVVCMVLYIKMSRVFREILSTNYVLSTATAMEREAGIQAQKSLFWFGEPKIVISVIQFMQFGYALALAIVIMYWPYLGGSVSPSFYLFTALVCYGVFVWVLSKVLPQYTLCTSLGYLVDQKHLQEALALHRLHEAQKMQRRKLLIDFSFDGDNAICYSTTLGDSAVQSSDETTTSSSTSEPWSSSSINNNVAAMPPTGCPSTLRVDPLAAVLDGGQRQSTSSVSTKSPPALQKMESLAALVKTDTASLRQLLPGESFSASSTCKQSMNEAWKEEHGAHYHHHADQSLWTNCSLTAIANKLRLYFLGPSYQASSHVFGTLVVFFLIGMRVEAMNEVTEAFDSSDNTWVLALNVSFWCEMAMYCIFAVKGILVLLLFPASTCKTFHQKALNTSATLDLLLICTCMALLFFAEKQRCCENEVDEYDDLVEVRRHLADTSPSYYELEDCCLFWGSRTYGGLGELEPFTALISLRIFRFVFARFLVTCFNTESGQTSKDIRQSSFSKDTVKDNPSLEESIEKMHHGHGHHSHHGHHHSMREDFGTPLELWEKAITTYPDVVAKYGQFSSELFQAMLGLEIAEDPRDSGPALLFDQKSTESADHPGTTASEAEPNSNFTPISAHAEGTKPRITLNDEKYRDLSAEARGMIIAGKIGKPVKAVSSLLHQSTCSGILSSSEEHAHMEHHGPPAEFEIDDDEIARETQESFLFVEPNARLIRSMRRCDRRMLPLLKEWVPVDVVITQFEIVYFEAVENEGAVDLEAGESGKKPHCLSALQATNGGKGLRLCDVAAGRKIVGHVDLEEVTDVHVERGVPFFDKKEWAVFDFDIDLTNDIASEYWTKGTRHHVVTEETSRKTRWKKVKEDRLCINSVHGSLYLRFYSDLDDSEAQFDQSAMGDELKKSISLEWAQTIVHLCWKHIKHAPPDTGEGDSDERRNFLGMFCFHEKEAEETSRKRHHIKTISLGYTPSMPSLSLGLHKGASNHGTSQKPKPRHCDDDAKKTTWRNMRRLHSGGGADVAFAKPKLERSKSAGHVVATVPAQNTSDEATTYKADQMANQSLSPNTPHPINASRAEVDPAANQSISPSMDESGWWAQLIPRNWGTSRRPSSNSVPLLDEGD